MVRTEGPWGLAAIFQFPLIGTVGRKTTKCDMVKFAPKLTRMETSFANPSRRVLPHRRLEDPEALATEVADAQRQFRAKLEVIRDLEGALRLPPETDESEQQLATAR